MFNTQNTTHEEAVRLLNERDAKLIDLYNTINTLSKQNRELAEKYNSACDRIQELTEK